MKQNECVLVSSDLISSEKDDIDIPRQGVKIGLMSIVMSIVMFNREIADKVHIFINKHPFITFIAVSLI